MLLKASDNPTNRAAVVPASALPYRMPASVALFAQGGGRRIVADQGAMLARAVDAVSCLPLAAAGTIAAAHCQLTFLSK